MIEKKSGRYGIVTESSVLVGETYSGTPRDLIDLPYLSYGLTSANMDKNLIGIKIPFQQFKLSDGLEFNRFSGEVKKFNETYVRIEDTILIYRNSGVHSPDKRRQEVAKASVPSDPKFQAKANINMNIDRFNISGDVNLNLREFLEVKEGDKIKKYFAGFEQGYVMLQNPTFISVHRKTNNKPIDSKLERALLDQGILFKYGLVKGEKKDISKHFKVDVNEPILFSTKKDISPFNINFL